MQLLKFELNGNPVYVVASHVTNITKQTPDRAGATLIGMSGGDEVAVDEAIEKVTSALQRTSLKA